MVTLAGAQKGDTRISAFPPNTYSDVLFSTKASTLLAYTSILNNKLSKMLPLPIELFKFSRQSYLILYVK